MNILFFNSIAEDTWGGGEKWMLTCARGLRDRRSSVFFSGREGSAILKTAAQNGFKTFALKIGGDFNPVTIRQLTAVLKSQKIDIIVANFNKDVRLGGLAKRFGKGTLLVARNGLPILPDKLVYRMTYKRLADGMITNTVQIKKKYLRYGWLDENFIRVIHNGIDTNLHIKFDRAKVLREFGLPANRPVTGIFGRLAGQKQHHLFLEVAANLRKKIKDAVFIIVGDGPLHKNIRQKIDDLGLADCVFMLGMQEKVMELYSICDLVLLTSYKEGLPNVVMEAMLAAKPVVAFDAGGIRELIPDDSSGIVVPVNDVKTMTKAAQKFLSENAYAQSTGQIARNRILDFFSTEKMIDEVERYFTGLLGV